MNPTEQKGEIVGSITLHINSKLRVSHVEIQDRGDLVSRRTIQDSMMLIFRAMSHKRAGRKASGRVAEAEEVKKAEGRDRGRLEAYRKQRAEEEAKAEADLQARIQARIDQAAQASAKAEIQIKPGHTPKRVDREAAKKAAIEAANKHAEKLSAENAKKELKLKTEPVTAAKAKEK